MKAVIKFLDVIDLINEKIGYYFGMWLIVAILIAVFVSVVARYFFDYAFDWSLEFPKIVQLGLMCAGGGYALLHHAHIRVDVIYSHWSARTKARVDSITFLFILVIMVFIVRDSFQSALMHYGLHAIERQAGIEYPLVILDIVVLIGGFIFGLQALAEEIRNIAMAVKGVNLESKLLIENKKEGNR